MEINNSNFFYKKVKIIGSGRLPKNCIKTLLQFNLELICVEPVKTKFPLLSEFCRLQKINYYQILDILKKANPYERFS